MLGNTKKLFNAPWQIMQNYTNFIDVVNNKSQSMGTFVDIKDANRFKHLPELYAALEETLAIICGIEGENACKQCSNGDLDCPTREWRELLKKVKEGK